MTIGSQILPEIFYASNNVFMDTVNSFLVDFNDITILVSNPIWKISDDREILSLCDQFGNLFLINDEPINKNNYRKNDFHSQNSDILLISQDDFPKIPAFFEFRQNQIYKFQEEIENFNTNHILNLVANEKKRLIEAQDHLNYINSLSELEKKIYFFDWTWEMADRPNYKMVDIEHSIVIGLSNLPQNDAITLLAKILAKLDFSPENTMSHDKATNWLKRSQDRREVIAAQA